MNPRDFTDLAMWNLLLGFLLPLVVAIVQQPKFSDPARALVTFVACVFAGAGTAYFEGSFTGRGIVSSILLTLVVALTTHRNFWKPSGVTPRIEAATSTNTT